MLVLILIMILWIMMVMILFKNVFPLQYNLKYLSLHDHLTFIPQLVPISLWNK